MSVIQALPTLRFAEAFGETEDEVSVPPGSALHRCRETVRDTVAARQGFVLVTGARGLGKSTILRSALEGWRDDRSLVVGAIGEPGLWRTDGQFLRATLAQFGLAADGRSALAQTTALAEGLRTLRSSGRRALLAIDDGQQLTGSHLELLRTFLMLDMPNGLLELVLFAEPSLRERIARKRNLASRVAREVELQPLDRADTERVIAHRLRLAGDPGHQPFDESAIDAIAQRSGGVPSAIVRLCREALLAADTRATGRIDAAGVIAADRVAGDAANEAFAIQVRLPMPEFEPSRLDSR